MSAKVSNTTGTNKKNVFQTTTKQKRRNLIEYVKLCQKTKQCVIVEKINVTLIVTRKKNRIAVFIKQDWGRFFHPQPFNRILKYPLIANVELTIWFISKAIKTLQLKVKKRKQNRSKEWNIFSIEKIVYLLYYVCVCACLWCLEFRETTRISYFVSSRFGSK